MNRTLEPEATDTLDVDEITVADQIMISVRVIRQNFTFLYQHLAVAHLLPALIEKGVISETKRQEVEAYSQKYAQNVVVMTALFVWEYMLGKLTDMLAMTPGQEHVARKLLDGKW